MKDAVLTNEILVDIRKNGVRQVQFRRDFLTVGGTIGTQGYHLCAQALDLGVIFLQLTELRAAKPSSLGPVEDYQHRLLAFKGTQIDGCSLN